MLRTEDPHAPVEVLDLIVDLAGDHRRSVQREDAVDRCRAADDRWASRLVAGLPAPGGVLEEASVDDLVLGVHREIDRLSAVARNGPRIANALYPMIQVLAETGHAPPYRVVDQGCGTGHVVRWLAAHGMPDGVELVGVDVNPHLVAEATRLADRAGLACRFEVGDALDPDHGATIIMSTALLHHLSSEELVAYFAAQEAGSAVGFMHLDLRAGPLTVLGVALVHRVLMRLPVSRPDGIRSAQRAHRRGVLLEAARTGAPDFAVATGGLRITDPLAPMLTLLTGLRGPMADLAAPARCQLAGSSTKRGITRSVAAW